MNEKTVLIVFIMLFSLFINSIKFDIPKAEAVSSYSIDTAVDQYPLVENFQRKDFYAKTRWWIFYKDADASKSIVFRSTTNKGQTWSSATSFKALSEYDGDTFDLEYDSIEDKIHIVYENAPNGKLYYRRGTPNSDGTITWNSEQTILSYTPINIHFPSLAIDSNGYPWITTGGTSSSKYVMIYKSSLKDGTWNTQSGFPKTLTWNDASGAQGIAISLPLGKMYFLEAKGGHISGRVKGIAWDGANWGSEEYVSDMNIYYGNCMSASSDDNGYINFAYLVEGPYEIRFKARSPAGVWQTEQQVVTGSLDQYSWPIVTPRADTNVTFVFWGQSDDCLYYNMRVNGIWDTVGHILVNESSDHLSVYGGHYQIASSRKSMTSDNLIGVFYATDTYKLKIAPVILSGIASPINLGTTISDMEGCGNWLFAGEKYYTFTTSTQHLGGYQLIDTIQFKFSNGFRNVTVSYDRPNDLLTVPTDSEDYIGAIFASKNNSTNVFNFTAKIFLKTTISDMNDVDLYSWSNSTGGNATAWEHIITSTRFNIYNLGGGVTWLSSGAANASFTTGGDTFEIWAKYQGWIAVNQTWRNLQSYHTQFSLGFFDSNGNPAQDDMQDYTHFSFPDQYYTNKGDWKLNISIWYCDPYGVWVKGWTLQLMMEQGDKATSEQWIQLNATWYRQNAKVASGFITSFLEENPKARTAVWINLWFNQANASSVFGGRVNPYYYGMTGTAPWWWPWDITWGPKWDNETNSMGFQTLYDSHGQKMTSHEIKLMKIGYNLTRPQPNDSDNFKIVLTQFELDQKNIKTSGQMEGINTPEPDKTLTPDMAIWGIFAPIYAAITSIAAMIVRAFISALTSIAAAMTSVLDYVFGLFGWHGGFSQLLVWISSLLSWVPSAFGWMITFLIEIFLVLTAAIPLFIQTLVRIVSISLSIFTTLLALGNTIYGFFAAVWVYIDPFWSVVVQLLPYGVAFYVLYLLYLATTGQGDRAWELIKFTGKFIILLSRVTMFVFDIFYKVAHITLQIVMGLLDVI